MELSTRRSCDEEHEEGTEKDVHESSIAGTLYYNT